MEGKTTGIVCPKCGKRMEYHYTKHRIGYVRRSHRCLPCGVQVITREEIRVIVAIATKDKQKPTEID